jgi:hypothetical protein
VARVWGRVLATVVAVLAIAFFQARRSGLTITELFAGADDRGRRDRGRARGRLALGARTDFLSPQAVGLPVNARRNLEQVQPVTLGDEPRTRQSPAILLHIAPNRGGSRVVYLADNAQMSFKMPAAVTAGPAPGPLITRGSFL